ncbi:MAG TPA: hypothetical protein VMV29_24465, partial [Ktedonobacterales bacterium]|nr:hypothetical protein [Ktedonobacterales bacterium]
YKRFRNDARVALGEAHIPRRRFADDPARFLAELRELLPVIVGRGKATPAGGGGQPAASAKGERVSAG